VAGGLDREAEALVIGADLRDGEEMALFENCGTARVITTSADAKTSSHSTQTSASNPVTNEMTLKKGGLASKETRSR
jgi:hypothetical protein